ncbi:hypothetical protein [Aquipuribacter sp. MA13-6]|uniref:hypothetical protein n=1 Tax=unclassified Aquipuribacter TaxID=2635084 RepID=UPI003EEA68FE
MPITGPILPPTTTPVTKTSPRGLDARSVTAAAVLTGLLVVLAPVRHNWGRSPRDSFPLSHYPMFSARRRATARVVHPVGIRSDGTRSRLSYHYCGTGGFNQVRRQLRRAVKDGRAAQVVTDVALSVAAAARAEDTDVVAVEVVTGTYRYRSWFSGDHEPEKVVAHARADVPGRGADA